MYVDFLQEKAYSYRTGLYLAASASAEFFADIALCPMESVKVRVQTGHGYGTTLRECAPILWREERLAGWERVIFFMLSDLPAHTQLNCFYPSHV